MPGRELHSEEKRFIAKLRLYCREIKNGSPISNGYDTKDILDKKYPESIRESNSQNKSFPDE